MDTGETERLEPDSRRFTRGVTLIIVLYLLIAAIKVFLSFQFISPQVFLDEYLYDLIAQMTASGQLFLNNTPYPLVGFPPGYPALIGIPYLFTADKHLIYHLDLIINCLVSTSVIFPSYLILKRVAERWAVSGAALVAILPSVTVPTFLLMSENLLIPLYILSGYLIIRAFSHSGPSRYDLLLGLTFFLIFFVRVPGSAVFIAYIGTAILYAWGKNDTERAHIGKKALLVFLPTILLYSLYTVDQLITKAALPSGYRISDYIQNMAEIIQKTPQNLITAGVLQVDYILLGTYILVLFFCMQYLLRGFSEIGAGYPSRTGSYPESRSIRPEVLLLIVYVTISSLILLILGVIHVNVYSMPLLCGRYVDPFLPFIFIFGIAGFDLIWRERDHSLLPLAKQMLIFLLLSLLLIMVVPFPQFAEPNNNPATTFLCHLSSAPNFASPVFLIPLFLIILLYGILRRGVPPASMIAVLFAVSLIYAASPVVDEILVSQRSVGLLQFCDALNQVSPPQARIIWDNSTNGGPNDSISYASLGYWLGPRLIERDVGLIRTPDGRQGLSIPSVQNPELLITKKEYTLRKLCNIAGYNFYTFQITGQQ